jgi:hypothetical protein
VTRPGRQWFFALRLALAGVLGWIAWTSLPVDPETQAVRVAAEGAIRTLYFDAAPPSSYAGGPLAASDAGAIKARLSADIARYFTASLQARYLPMEFQFVDQIPTGLWDIGDLSISWGPASISGDQATISLDEHETTFRHFGNGAAPVTLQSTWHDHLSLVRQDGQWRVADYEGDCGSGCP